jgi:hypothetical protein
MSMRARSGVLAVLAVHYPREFTTQELTTRVRELVGEAPVESAIVELDSVGVLRFRKPLIRPGDPVRAFREAIFSHSHS